MEKKENKRKRERGKREKKEKEKEICERKFVTSKDGEVAVKGWHFCRGQLFKYVSPRILPGCIYISI